MVIRSFSDEGCIKDSNRNRGKKKGRHLLLVAAWIRPA